MEPEPIEIRYRFECDGDAPREFLFDVVLDGRTLNRLRVGTAQPPEWARFDRYRCPSCPLEQHQHLYCPAAVAVVDLLEPFGTLKSHTPTKVTVSTQERTVTAATTVQRALRSLLGLYMATSGCPILAKLKPMARFHLPFATRQETLFRSAGAYLLTQYYLKRRGEPNEFSLDGLTALYENIHTINIALAERLRGATQEDANINALALLDLFTQELPFSFKENLAEIEHLFAPFREGTDGPSPSPQRAEPLPLAVRD